MITLLKTTDMRKTIIFTALFCMACAVHAQIITGKIVDDKNEPVDFATLVLQTPDSVFVLSAYSDSLGAFRFKSELPAFRLIIQHLLYESYDHTYSNPDVGTIQLKSKENFLNEIVIKGERPLVTVVDGKMTYNISRLVENKVVGNAYESLLQLPGVREQSDNLVLAGANSLTVIINGKPTGMSTEQLTQLLKTMPVSMLEKAEVLYSAPPQYHVRGAAINLILQNHTSEKPRLTGQVNSAYEQKYYANYSAGTNLSYRTARFSTDFLYAVNQSHVKTGEDQYSHHLFENQVYNIDQFDRGENRRLTHNLRLATDYRLNDENKISLAYTTQISPHFKNTINSTGTYSHSVNEKIETAPLEMHNVDLNYTSGFGLNAGADYTYYQNHNQQNFMEKKPEKERTFLSYSNQDINRLNTYIDQSHTLSTWVLNYGAKYAHASEKSLQTYHFLSGQDSTAFNTDSRLEENTYDLYAGFQKSFSPQFSLSASLTGEYYQFEDFHEWTIFPSLEASYVFSPVHIVQLSVSSDKAYPSYWEMNGSIGYANGYGEIHGNPQLKPFKDYTAQLSYILKNKYMLTLYTTYEDNYFVQLPYQSPERLAMIYKVTNFDYKQSAGVNLITPFTIGSILNSRLTLNGFYARSKSSHFFDTSFDNKRWTAYSRLDNTVNISSKPDIKAELSAVYLTPSIQGPMDLSAVWSMDTGIKWTFADKKAELRLKGTDLFNSMLPDVTMLYANQNLQMNMHPDLRIISLSFTYKFGGESENKKRKEVDTSRFGN
jgi:hypothetical protein